MSGTRRPRRRFVLMGLMLTCIIAWLQAQQSTPGADFSGTGAETPTDATAARHRRARRPLPVRTGAGTTGFALSGRVETLHGAPVEGARVGFRPGHGSGVPSMQQLDPVVETDAQGQFTLQVDEPGVLTVVDGASPATVTVDRSRADLLFQRGESCALAVQVLDPEGRPVPHYTFALSYRDATMPAHIVSRRTGPFQTDPSGALQLRHAPCSRLAFHSATGDQAPLVPASVDTLLEQSVTLTVMESVRVEGTLVDAEDQPVEAGVVYVFWSNARPGAPGIRSSGSAHGPVHAGAFALEVPPEQTLQFSATAPDLEAHTPAYTAPAVGDGPLEVHLRLRAGRVVTVSCADDASTCRPKTEPTCRWTDAATGEAREDGCMLEPDRRHFTCVCGPDAAWIEPGAGYASIEVDATMSRVTLSHAGSERDADPPQTARGTASLEVTLVGTDGAFYPAAGVMLQIRSEGETPVRDQALVASVDSTRFSQLPAGAYQVRALDPKTLHHATETVQLDEGESGEVELTLEP